MDKILNDKGIENAGKLLTAVIDDVLARIKPVADINDLGEFTMSLYDYAADWMSVDSLSSCKLDYVWQRDYLELGVFFNFPRFSQHSAQLEKLWTAGKDLFPEVSRSVDTNVRIGHAGLANIIFQKPSPIRPDDPWQLRLAIVYLPEEDEMEII